MLKWLWNPEDKVYYLYTMGTIKNKWTEKDEYIDDKVIVGWSREGKE